MITDHHDDENDANQVKDVRVPAQLMRAMAAEAEAAREARAKVISISTIIIHMLLLLLMMMMMRWDFVMWGICRKAGDISIYANIYRF